MKKFKKIYIEITNQCNLRCSFCPSTKRTLKKMSLEEFEFILKQISTETDTIYLHVKGEPLLHPQLLEILQKAAQYKLKVNLTTNGIRFPESASDLAKCSALRKINFSLHCENNSPNYLEEIFKAVEKLPKEMIIIYRIWTLKDNTLDKKSTEIVEKLEEYYHLSPITVEKIKNETNIKISSTIYVDKDNEFEWPTLTTHQSCGYCYALKTHLAILVDGTVVPCCLDGEGIVNLGNIFETPLLNIIKSDKYQQMKKSFQDRKPIEKLCLSCTFKEKLQK